MITLGTDAAKWQGELSIEKLKECDVKFVYLKATHGVGGIDERFASNQRIISEGEIAMGAYHWFVPKAEPKEQAKRFVGLIENYFKLWPALDFEEETDMEATQLLGRFTECILHVEELTNRECIIYSGLWYWIKYLKGLDSELLGSRHYWHSSYPFRLGANDWEKAKVLVEPAWPHGTSSIPTPWVKRGGATIWQMDGNDGLRYPGGVDADFDAFKGNIEDMIQLAAPRMTTLLPRDPVLKNSFGWQPQTSATTATDGLVPDVSQGDVGFLEDQNERNPNQKAGG